MSFIYCNDEGNGRRWYYIESPNGGGSGFALDKSRAHKFASKEEAWAHCRRRRKGGFCWRSRKWVVIRLRSQHRSKP